jgi:hypothetical protein
VRASRTILKEYREEAVVNTACMKIAETSKGKSGVYIVRDSEDNNVANRGIVRKSEI